MGLEELVNIEYDNFIKVEESQLNRWRVHNGETWAHGFDTEQDAIKFAERMGAERIAYCKLINEEVHYINMKVVGLND